MKSGSPRRNRTDTAYVTLDTHKCKACWKCREICSDHVIGRINLPWHKHVLFVHGNKCKGCLKCVNVCEANALQRKWFK